MCFTHTLYGIKNVLFLCYVSSYYITLVSLVSFFLFYNIKKIKYLTELSFYSNYGWLYYLFIFSLVTFMGLPPFILFFPKLSLISLIILNQNFFFLISAILILFYGWFIYLNVIKLISTQQWSFNSEYDFLSKYLNSQLAVFLVIQFWILLFGFIFFFDLYCYFNWLLI